MKKRSVATKSAKRVGRRRFQAALVAGHKGAAIIVPFDPEAVWGIPAQPLESRTYGTRPGHLVSGKINGRAFEGWIGFRWGRFFILIDDAFQEAAGIAIGDSVGVEIALRTQGQANANAKARTGTRRRAPTHAAAQQKKPSRLA